MEVSKVLTSADVVEIRARVKKREQFGLESDTSHKFFQVVALCDSHAALERERDEAISSRKHTQDWYGSRWQRMHEWFRSPEMKDTKAADEWFSILANGGLLTGDPPVCFMAKVNLTRFALDQANERIADLTAQLAERDKALAGAREALESAKVDSDTIAYAHSIRADLQTVATLRENWQHTFDAAWNGRARVDDALNESALAALPPTPQEPKKTALDVLGWLGSDGYISQEQRAKVESAGLTDAGKGIDGAGK